MKTTLPALKSLIFNRIDKAGDSFVWTPIDFIDLANRANVDKILQRLALSGYLQRIERGLYTKIRINSLTGNPAAVDYHKVIEAVSRREQVRILIDGLSAANALGLTNAVPGKVIVHTDGRLRPIHIDNLTIHFKLTAPSKLYWSNRPAMYMIQALYWLRDSLANLNADELAIIEAKIIRILSAPQLGKNIRNDIMHGLHTLPTWMQEWILKLIKLTEKKEYIHRH